MKRRMHELVGVQQGSFLSETIPIYVWNIRKYKKCVLGSLPQDSYF